MNRLILTLLLVWLVVAVVGAVIQGFFWLTLVAMALLLGTGAVGEAIHPPRTDVSPRTRSGDAPPAVALRGVRP
jgi:hypothetical protein